MTTPAFYGIGVKTNGYKEMGMGFAKRQVDAVIESIREHPERWGIMHGGARIAYYWGADAGEHWNFNADLEVWIDNIPVFDTNFHGKSNYRINPFNLFQKYRLWKAVSGIGRIDNGVHKTPSTILMEDRI